MIKVSICVPTYNNPDEVERLLQSIYMQKFTNFEVNISDDSKDEKIAEIVKNYQSKYGDAEEEPNRTGALHYVHNQTALGHIFNWNAAIQMARGEYIKIMFSDDWFTDSESLGQFVEMLDWNQEAMLAFCGSRQVMLDGQGDGAVKHVTKEHDKDSYDRYAADSFINHLNEDYRNLFLGNQIGTPSATMYRRAGSLSLFDEQSNWASDMFLYFDILKKSATFAYTREPLICVGVHANQYTESFSERDMRIYNDYRYMYTKYDLQENKACREYFTEKFIIKYHKGLQEAKNLGISQSMYWKKWVAEQKETVKCFVKHRLKRNN